jgi:type II secretion system protein C
LLQHGLLAVQALIVVACLYLVYGMVMEVIGGASVPALTLPPIEAPSVIDRPPQRYDVIGARNLFNTLALAPPEPEPELAEEIAESQLRVTLIGTAAAMPQELSVAAVETSSRERIQVRVGDQLEGRKVVGIERKRLILEFRGQLEAIEMDEEAPQGGPGPTAPAGLRARTATAARTPSRAPRTPRTPRAATRLSERLRKLGTPTRALSGPPPAREPPAEKRVEGLLEQSRVQPVYNEEGESTGLEVNWVKPQSSLSELGVQVGDTIQFVNGVRIGSPEEGMRMLRQLGSDAPIQIELDRKGEPITIEYTPEAP